MEVRTPRNTRTERQQLWAGQEVDGTGALVSQLLMQLLHDSNLPSDVRLQLTSEFLLFQRSEKRFSLKPGQMLACGAWSWPPAGGRRDGAGLLASFLVSFQRV